MGAVLTPAGLIAQKELAVMTDAFFLMLITTIAVFSLAIFFAYWYREGNTRAVYLPDWEHGALSELVWWAVPFEIVLILGALLYSSTHALDPRRALVATEPPLEIQAVALPGEWLFIYPEYNVALAGELRLPVGRPLAFSITADAPMNSLWIPKLGGQIYAMTGMETTLHLMADDTGEYRGGSANYSGVEFAQMSFTAYALPPLEFGRWAAEVIKTSEPLTYEVYEVLRNEGTDLPHAFGKVEDGLFESIMMKYMSPAGEMHAR